MDSGYSAFAFSLSLSLRTLEGMQQRLIHREFLRASFFERYAEFENFLKLLYTLASTRNTNCSFVGNCLVRSATSLRSL